MTDAFVFKAKKCCEDEGIKRDVLVCLYEKFEWLPDCGVVKLIIECWL